MASPSSAPSPARARVSPTPPTPEERAKKRCPPSPFLRRQRRITRPIPSSLLLPDSTPAPNQSRDRRSTDMIDHLFAPPAAPPLRRRAIPPRPVETERTKAEISGTPHSSITRGRRTFPALAVWAQYGAARRRLSIRLLRRYRPAGQGIDIARRPPSLGWPRGGGSTRPMCALCDLSSIPRRDGISTWRCLARRLKRDVHVCPAPSSCARRFQGLVGLNRLCIALSAVRRRSWRVSRGE